MVKKNTSSVLSDIVQWLLDSSTSESPEVPGKHIPRLFLQGF